VSEVSTIEQGMMVAQPVAAGQSLQTMAWRQLWRKRTALVGIGIIVVLVLTATLAHKLKARSTDGRIQSSGPKETPLEGAMPGGDKV